MSQFRLIVLKRANQSHKSPLNYHYFMQLIKLFRETPQIGCWRTKPKRERAVECDVTSRTSFLLVGESASYAAWRIQGTARARRKNIQHVCFLQDANVLYRSQIS
ncbi:hypothetical protein F2P79_005837 [Pimephales promelas]|nr:hypothetical protein F2P79_005837 [Pimephales promelas]